MYSQPLSPMPSTTVMAPELRTAKRSPGAAGGEQLAAGGAVQAGVANDAGFMAAEGGADRWTHRDAAAGHAFADIVVGVAGQGQLDAAGVPDAEALPGGAGEVRLDRIGRHALIAVHVGDSADSMAPTERSVLRMSK